jgi:serine/threonine protein phosphatase PrpC
VSAAVAVAVGAVRLSVCELTDTGRKRKVNEDSILVSSPVFLVADGMGGYEAGDRASAAVVDAFRTHLAGDGFGTLDSIRDALLAADAGVAVVAGDTKRGAGSTVAGAVLIEHEGEPFWLVFNVGDSRVYRHYGSDLEQLTVDHSLGQEKVDRGEMRREDMAGYAERNVITRAIGAADSTADSWLVPVTNGERLHHGRNPRVGRGSARAARQPQRRARQHLGGRHRRAVGGKRARQRVHHRCRRPARRPGRRVARRHDHPGVRETTL